MGEERGVAAEGGGFGERVVEVIDRIMVRELHGDRGEVGAYSRNHSANLVNFCQPETFWP